MLLAQPCPAALPGVPLPAPPRPPFARYDDPQLQAAYAHIVAALRTPTVVGRNLFTPEEADQMARHAVDAVRGLPDSPELRERLRCAITPAVRFAAGQETGRQLAWLLVLQLGGIAGAALFKLLR